MRLILFAFLSLSLNLKVILCLYPHVHVLRCYIFYVLNSFGSYLDVGFTFSLCFSGFVF